MNVLVNGEVVKVIDDCSVAQLLEQLKITTRFVAVEVNQDIVPRDLHTRHLLRDGDQLEVVTLVGGG